MKSDLRPNILFIHTDQQRGDCLSCEGHPVLQTPNMDNIARNGTRFSSFYSACPSCIATRRSILTGQSPQKHGLVGYRDGLEFDYPTLPGVLRNNGYQTVHIGRSMHQYPFWKYYGFEIMELGGCREHTDYREWFNEQNPGRESCHMASGVMHNDWTARPWNMEEYLHPTNWTVERALRFLKKHDPTRPFFMSLGFIAPHPPLNPPAYYFERYQRLGVPDPVIGNWEEYIEPQGYGDFISSPRVKLTTEQNLCARAAYYGLINHVDDQLRRLINPVNGIKPGRDTVIIFTSDHGELLGDHYLWRKSRPFEGSARVPFLISLPESFGTGIGKVIDKVATHADIMPTVLDMLDIPVPDSVDGLSLFPLLRGEQVKWRECVHIEHSPNDHALTDGKQKYIWNPRSGRELFFDLVKDRQEVCNLADKEEYREKMALWRQRLIERLRDRPGHVKNGCLTTVKEYPAVIT